MPFGWFDRNRARRAENSSVDVRSGASPRPRFGLSRLWKVALTATSVVAVAGLMASPIIGLIDGGEPAELAASVTPLAIVSPAKAELKLADASCAGGDTAYNRVRSRASGPGSS